MKRSKCGAAGKMIRFEIRVLASDGKIIKEIAWMNLIRKASGEKTILGGVSIELRKSPDEKPVRINGRELDFDHHFAYHESGEYHLMSKLYGQTGYLTISKREPLDELKGSILLFQTDFPLMDLNRWPGKPVRKNGETKFVTVNTSQSKNPLFRVKMYVVQPGTEPVVEPGEELHPFNDYEPWLAIVVSRPPFPSIRKRSEEV